ncbi:MAG: acetylglutamate kinase [Saprospiraceae bacterium]|jgi:acetylglutamate kinase
MSKDKLEIIKIGGKLINEERELLRFLEMLTTIDNDIIIIHGGGRKATELSALLGISTQMIDGRRITNKETLEVAIMVYAGLVNKNLVALLQSMRIDAIGLCGADANIIQAHKRPVKEIDYGFVGDIESVDGGKLGGLLSLGLTPALCAISHNTKGQLLNTNADTIAAQVAIAMSSKYEVSLKYCFEFLGVLHDISDHGNTIRTIAASELESMKEAGVINAGMLPKLSNGFDALNQGVDNVSICGIENLISQKNATHLIK